ncbi:MAG: flavodoxin-dependent (E)-4-hydroxy-3-methylbut-2-enyl-diphosphate synthase [bacterium]
MNRHKVKTIQIGQVKIGGDAPVTVQSMTKTDTRNAKKTIRQIKRLEKAGCEIIRVAVPDEEAVRQLSTIKKNISIPLIADIHFDHKLAIKSIQEGADAIRINPGNISDNKKIVEIIKTAHEYNIPIRIGVNAGSLEKHLLTKYHGPTPEALVESALNHIKTFEDIGFYQIKLSLKSSNINDTVHAYRLIAKKTDYPLHLGITEAGPLLRGSIKSAIGLGILLAEGIGDTIRVSLTDAPLKEIQVAYEILKGLEIRKRGVEIISCPTCGRCQVDIIKLTRQIEKKLAYILKPIKVAVMGCVVNGPGEARECDIGIAGGKGQGVLFRKGKIIKKIREPDLLQALMEEVENYAQSL